MGKLTKEDVNYFIMNRIGPQVYARDIDDLGNHDYKVSFGVVFPKLINDFTDGEKEYLRYIKFDNIKSYEFAFEKELIPKSRIDRMEIYSKAYSKLYELSLDTEAIVLNATYSYLAKISFIRTALNPIYSILAKINRDDAAKPIEFAINQRKYFDLLESEELIRKKTDTYSYERGNAFIKIEDLLEDAKKDEIINYVFGFAIKKGKKYIIDHLKIKSIIPFLRIANTYYSLALKANELIHTTVDELMLEHRNIYNTGLGCQFRTKFESHLDNIIQEAGILEENKYYYGKESIFKKLQEEAQEVKIMSALGYTITKS